MDGLVSSRGGTALYRPLCSFLYRREGTDLYRPLRSVLYSRGRGTALYRPLCSVLYSRGGTALYHPLCSVLHSGGEGTALYRPLYSVFYRREGGRLSPFPCVRLLIGISIVFRGGDGVRYTPPPLSGGGTLNNSTGAFEKKNARPWSP